MMKGSNTIRYFNTAVAAFGIVASPISLAITNSNSETIYSSSIKWEDEVNRIKLLEIAPKWHDDVMQLMFDVYRNPERYQMTRFQDVKHYNVQFINAFWGPLNNPFNKYERPTKAFAFVSKTSKPGTVFMAPLIQSLADGNYYVFDKDQSQPVLLNDWITNIKINHSDQFIRFNLCNGYGNSANDSCHGKSYQDEASDITRGNKLSTEAIPSSHRDINEDWKTKVKSAAFLKANAVNSIYSDSISWANVDERNKLLTTVETWPNYNAIKENFGKIRDIRYFNDESSPNFQRRISWLYPDDGCWTRASAAIKDLFGPYKNVVNHFSRPSKLFAFGNLCVNTNNSPNRRVTWWYHTAPIVRDAQTNQTYVLDPAVNPYEPLTTEKWMAEVSSQTGACAGSSGNVNTFNICNGYGASPYDNCSDRVNFANEIRTMLNQSTYRSYERERQEELGRDANKVLGDLPPWLNS